MGPKIELHQTRDFGRKLNATIEFIKENFKPLFKCLLFIPGPFVIIGSLLFIQIFQGFMRMSLNQTNPNLQGDFENLIIYGIAGGLFLVLGGTAVVATVNEYIKLYEKQGNEITVNEVWEQVKKAFWTVLGTMILYVLILIGAYLVLLLPLFIFTAISPLMAFPIMLVLLGMMLYLIINLTLLFIIRAYENVGFATAVSRCFKLVKGKWWSTFGILIVTSIIQGTISSIFYIPWYVIMIWNMAHNMDTHTIQEPNLAMEIMGQVFLLFYMICSYIMYCIPLIAIAFQYFNLVEMKEATGLMKKIDDFGTEEKSKDEDEEHY